MTYVYSTIDPQDALYLQARNYPGGVNALAVRMGRSPNVLYKQLRPAVDTHHISFEDVSLITEFCADARQPDAYLALQAFCWRHGHLAVRLPDADVGADASELFQTVLSILQAEGALASQIQSSIANDGKIDRNEVVDIEEALERCVTHLMQLREMVRAKHGRDFSVVGG